MNRFASLSLLGLLLAAPAHSGGPTPTPTEPDVVPLAASPAAPAWDGLYAGLAVSLPQGDNFWSDTLPEPSSPADWSGNLTYLTLGYDRQAGRLVYGGALDFALGTLAATGDDGPDFGCGGTGCTTEVSDYMALRARVGYAVGKALVYGTAGFAKGGATVIRSDIGTVGPADTSGWVAGAGVEVMLSSRLSVDLSYLYNDLGRVDIPMPCTNSCFTDVTFGQARLGLNLRF